MTTETKLLGCLAQFALAGTIEASPSAGTTGVAYIPSNAAVDGSAAALWVSLGIISKWEPKVSSSKVEVYKPSPGTLSLSDIKRSKFKRELTITITDCSNVMWLAANRALAVTSPRTSTVGQYVPLTSGTLKGWLKAQFYNQDTNSQEVAEQVWGEMDVEVTNIGDDKNMEFKLTFTQLWSALNSATGS
jgi:hypothetical protein